MNIVEAEPFSFAAYEEFVEEVRYPDPPDFEWRTNRARQIQNELLEVLTQHGDGASLLFPSIVPVEPGPGLVHKVADELSDSGWFLTDVTLRAGHNLSSVTTEALRRHVSPALGAITTFRELDESSTQHAQQITVPNKYGQRTSLAHNPFYLLMRTQDRLIQTLDPTMAMAGGPPTATQLEGLTDLPEALGDAYLTLSYIANERLGVSLERITQFNMLKLSHREVHGKANDISFEDFLGQEA